MLPTTLEAIRALLKTDSTLTPEDRSLIITLIRNHGKAGEYGKSLMPEKRIIRRSEVAKRLSVSLRTVDKLVSKGILHKARFPGRGRSCGLMAEDIDKFMDEIAKG